MIDLKELNAAIRDLATEATETEGTDASVELVLASFATQITAAVTAALTADAAANAASIAAAATAIATVKDSFVASRTKLAAAIVANPLP